MTETTWALDAMEAVEDRGMIPSYTPVLFVYKTGTTLNPDIEWTEADISALPQLEGVTVPHVYRIHQGFGTRNSFRTDDGIPWDEIDMEAGAWGIADTLRAVRDRNGIQWSTRIYASDTPWTDFANEALRSGVSLKSVYWREANWSLDRFQAQGRIGQSRRYAVQWASPSSNPLTRVPGSTVELQTSNLDLNEIGLRFTGWQGL